jgi:polyhydroxyalkanoate synthesis regulator phasin
MTYLPQDRNDEAATKSDVAAVRDAIHQLGDRFDRLEDRSDRLEDRFDRLEVTMRDQLKTYTLTTVGSMTALTAIFALVVGLIR